MNKIIKAIVLSSSLIATGAAYANQEAQQLSICLTDSMNGKERKNLAKWIFFGMSSHSSIKPFSKVTESDIGDSSKYVGALITRLITEDCPSQAKAASKVLGSAAFDQAFKVVGEVAMQELMAEPSVGHSLGAFEKHLDKEKFNAVFQ
ncbi:hypothetical protein QT397_24805 [Microbulbifer sp. MKSA007]|nr:hypothetical protein QT397_24805 [Microbulbifer sp. MKSA007]